MDANTLIQAVAAAGVAGAVTTLADVPLQTAGTIAVVVGLVLIVVRLQMAASAKPAAPIAVDSEDEQPVKPSKSKKGKKNKSKKKKNKKVTPAPAPVESASEPDSEPVEEPEPEPVKEPEVVETKKASKKSKKKKNKTKAAPVEAAPEPVPEPEVELTKKQKKRLREKKRKEEERLATEAAAKKAAEEHSRRSALDDDDDWHQVSRRPRRVDEKTGNSLVSDEMAVPSNKHGAIIGEGGAYLRALQEATGTTINVPDRESHSKWVQIKGTKKGVADVKKAINDLLTKGYSRITHPDSVDQHISLSEQEKFRVLGRGGSHIQALQKATNTKIQMPDRDATHGRCFIVGRKPDVVQAKQYIKQLIKYGWSPVTHPNETMFSMEFPMEMNPRIIGREASTIRNIQNETDTRIHLPRQEGDLLSITGTVEGIEACRARIDKILNPPEEPDFVDASELNPNDPWSHSDDTLSQW